MIQVGSGRSGELIEGTLFGCQRMNEGLEVGMEVGVF